MSEQKVVLITGASTGFGRETAALLSQKFYRVFGTTRRQLPGLLTLDVTSDDSVHACVEKILSIAGRIDILINNAGFVINGLAEEVTLEQAKSIFETNFFGCTRMINAVLPIMRKQNQGRIINISSLAGLVATPGHAHYSATKFALEGYTESLNYELKTFNIQCALIEPGFFKTDLNKNMVQAAQTIPDYSFLRSILIDIFEKGVRTGQDPAKVANLILKVIESNAPKLRYSIGPGAPWVQILKCLLPQKLFIRGVRKFFHLP
ncbi:MAG: SDR family NAD(P)-dependent oxidoreductase [Phycisphaerae bacterium]